MDKFKDCLATRMKAFECEIQLDGKYFATARVRSPLPIVTGKQIGRAHV